MATSLKKLNQWSNSGLLIRPYLLISWNIGLTLDCRYGHISWEAELSPPCCTYPTVERWWPGWYEPAVSGDETIFPLETLDQMFVCLSCDASWHGLTTRLQPRPQGSKLAVAQSPMATKMSPGRLENVER